MITENFTLENYFKRIGFTGEAIADSATVKALMQHQLYTVPFENLDVLAGKIVSLEPEDIVEKTLHQNRGGYCYELNGLFTMVLQALNIPYQFAAARPLFYPVKRPRTHMVLIVHIDDREWLYDLGFGSYGIREPMALDELDIDIQQGSDTFMLSQDETQEFTLQANVDGEWIKQMSFNRCPQEWIDFAPANYLNSTHPDAVFTQKPLILRHTSTGRHILFGHSLKSINNGQTTQRSIQANKLAATLLNYFNLHIP